VRTRWFSLTGWRWVAPGLLLGLGLGLVVARRDSRDDEPHQVLVDREPERTPIAG
jgi:cytochrome c-type biogenesis protein CcmH/NrfF